MMSDSDSDCLTSRNNVFTFQSKKMPSNERTVVRATGPNCNRSMNLCFNNYNSNIERNGYLGSHTSQHMYNQRETSPMSLRSVYDYQPTSFQQSFCRGLGQSTNRRSASPCSVRSIGSNAAVTGTDIALAIKNMKFNKYDMRIIQEACKKTMKGRLRKKIEKRRKLKLFLKDARRKSHDDSGDLGSDSSLSSDDCKSTRTGITVQHGFSRNISAYSTHLPKGQLSDDALSCRTDISKIRNTMKDSRMYRDCSDNIRNSSFKNMFSMKPNNFNSSRLNGIPVQKSNMTFQNDRFNNNFLLPSQRFNKSMALPTMHEKPIIANMSKQNSIFSRWKKHPAQKPVHNIQTVPININSDQDSEEKEQAEVTVVENISQHQRKRSHDSSGSDTQITNIKKRQLEDIRTLPKITATLDDENSEFIFARPQFPVRKSNNLNVQEKMLAKSNNNIERAKPTIEKLINQSEVSQINENKAIEPSETTQSSIGDVSSRPSFMRRKLFTQTLDITERKNLSGTESPSDDSPQSKMYKNCKEKNKARKLVTSQSCLSREVPTDNNLLDLIQKIVPPDSLKASNATLRTETNPKEKANMKTKITQEKTTEPNKKWDVSKIISICDNDDDMSDTYTDEEIFSVHGETKNKNNTTKLPTKTVIKAKLKQSDNKVTTLNNALKQNVSTKRALEYANTFWNCDSDCEGIDTPMRLNAEQNETKVDRFQGELNNLIKSNNIEENKTNASKIEKAKTKELNNIIKKPYGGKSCDASPPANARLQKDESIKNNEKIQNKKIVNAKTNTLEESQPKIKKSSTMKSQEKTNEIVANTSSSHQVRAKKVVAKPKPSPVKPFSPAKSNQSLNTTLRRSRRSKGSDLSSSFNYNKRTPAKKTVTVNKIKGRKSRTNVSKTKEKTPSKLKKGMTGIAKVQEISRKQLIEKKIHSLSPNGLQKIKEKSVKQKIRSSPRNMLSKNITLEIANNDAQKPKNKPEQTKNIVNKQENDTFKQPEDLNVSKRGRPRKPNKNFYSTTFLTPSKSVQNKYTTVKENKETHKNKLDTSDKENVENIIKNCKHIITGKLNDTHTKELENFKCNVKDMVSFTNAKQTVKGLTRSGQCQQTTLPMREVKVIIPPIQEFPARREVGNNKVIESKLAFNGKSNTIFRYFGVGPPKSTIGIMPRHCRQEATYINDDSRSITTRSMSSSIMTRSNKLKYLHV